MCLENTIIDLNKVIFFKQNLITELLLNITLIKVEKEHFDSAFVKH